MNKSTFLGSRGLVALALGVQYAIFAVAVLYEAGTMLFGGALSPVGLRLGDAHDALTAAVVSAALTGSITIVVIRVRPRSLAEGFSAVPTALSIGLVFTFGLIVFTHPTAPRTQPRSIGVHLLMAGARIEERDGRNTSVLLPKGGTYDGIPIVGWFGIGPDGSIDSFQDLRIAHDFRANGAVCSARYPVKVRASDIVSCTPKSGTSIDGVPCVPNEAVAFTGVAGARVRCTLARAFRSQGIRWPSGTEVDLSTDTYIVGPVAPQSLRFRGKALARGTLVGLGNGATTIELPGTFVLYCASMNRSECGPFTSPIPPSEFRFDGKPLAALER